MREEQQRSFLWNDSPSSPWVASRASDPTRLGAHLVGDGVDVAVVAPHAHAVEICFFDSPSPHSPQSCFRLLSSDDGVWHGHIPGIHSLTTYGYRAWGPWDPDQGLFYNPAKLLLDPYARAISGTVELSQATHAHITDDDLYPVYPLQPDHHDSAPSTVRGVVLPTPPHVTPGPNTPWSDTVIYEAHVKGFTKNLEVLPEDIRGTYAGLGHPETIRYLKDLGITAIELLPIHAKLSEKFLTERGLTNYWGYSTLSYFSPEPSYASAAAQEAGPAAVVEEFAGMVSMLHDAGIEVIMDVVYNHTCEMSPSGQTVSWRGLDGALYYRVDHNTGSYIDFTGCGNSLDSSQARVTQMVVDSLRYWASDLGVDGFRFDLAVTNARMNNDFTPDHPLFHACLSDPILRTKKLIAEPWDLGPGGWQTGGFPAPFAAWNDRYRDCMRNYWLVDAATQAEGTGLGSGSFDLATRLSGSQDLFGARLAGSMRSPRHSINFIAAHDGFTMADLTAYNHKHNEDNLEGNRDGTDHNLSWNHGAEGRASGPVVTNEYLPQTPDVLRRLIPARCRSLRNLFTMLCVSAGTPMFVAGDESGRTQYGNNNAYCQDSEISWLDWDWTPFQHDMHRSVRYLLKLRHDHPVMRPHSFLTGKVLHGDQIPDLSWYDHAGKELIGDIWRTPRSRVLQMVRSGLPYEDDDLLVVINATAVPARVRLAQGRSLPWIGVWDTTWERPAHDDSQWGVSPSNEEDTPETSAHSPHHWAPGSVIDVDPLSVRVLFSADPLYDGRRE